MESDKLSGDTREYGRQKAKGKRGTESWLRSVSAFANGAGGVLVFGVASDGTVAGLKDLETASEAIRKKIRECIIPFPDVILKQKESADGRKALFLEVLSGQETPYYCMNGDTVQAYVRAGKESIPAGAEELKGLVLKKSNISFDQRVTEYTIQDFSFFSYCDSYEEWTGDKIKDKDYEEFGMVTNGRLTNAGALFADESPIGHSRLVCSRRQGIYKERGSIPVISREEYAGGLIALVNKGMNFIKRNEKVLWHEADGRKLEKPDYCDRSIFESIVNALVHRDYRISGSEICIDLFEDCLTISSPGGMPDGTFIQERTGDRLISVRRNSLLAELFGRIGYMEQTGDGLNRIKRVCREALNYCPEMEPEFYSDAGQFTVRLKNLNYVCPREEKIKDTAVILTENEKKILDLITDQPTISTDNISKLSRIAKRTVERTLQSLKKKGIVSRGGSRRSGYWIVDKSSIPFL